MEAPESPAARMPAAKSTELAPGIFVIESLLTHAECDTLIRGAENGGFEAAPIQAPGGPRVSEETRNNDRHVFDDLSLASDLFERSRHSLPSALGERRAVGLNERFRLYRYRPGQRFRWHADAPFRRDSGEISLLTYMIYLNDGYLGGATRFESVKVSGQAGMALVFKHGLLHEGAEVTQGIKYALRSDVMFR